MHRSPIFPLLLGLAATVAHGQQTTARIVKYHANDIVNVRGKMSYTTLIQLPPTERFWTLQPATRTSGSSIRLGITALSIRRRQASIRAST